MGLNLDKLREFLVEGDFLTKEKFDELAKESIAKKRSIQSLILDNEILKDEELGQVIANITSRRFVNLKDVELDKNLFNYLPQPVAQRQQAIVFGEDDKYAKVAVVNPDNTNFLNLLRKRLGKPLQIFLTTEDAIKDQMYNYKESLMSEFEKLLEQQIKSNNNTDLSAIIRMVDLILMHAYERNASDVHIDPHEKDTIIRYRVDGVLHDVLTIPQNLHDLIVTRIKVLSKLRTDEHQVPQDGKFQYTVEKSNIDVRVSIVPTTKGENVVMRLLAERLRQYTLKDIGFSKSDYVKIDKNIRKPWGMILVTGPTGSGKTTTLYSILKVLNHREVNIATIEDPVEYNIDGVTQIQVNPKANLKFVTGLRSIVRQDPDIIMVGEIRDKETADIAVNSAMTGHLVLSTIHTNDSATTLPRLLDMDVEQFLVASTVNVIIAQRLIRKICKKCIHSYSVDRKELESFAPKKIVDALIGEKEGSVRIYKGKGCSVCKNTGYHGRIGVFEVLNMDKDIGSLLMKNANAEMIKEKAIEKGMTTMLDDAVEKVLSGVTTLEEVIRVVR